MKYVFKMTVRKENSEYDQTMYLTLPFDKYNTGTLFTRFVVKLTRHMDLNYKWWKIVNCKVTEGDDYPEITLNDIIQLEDAIL